MIVEGQGPPPTRPPGRYATPTTEEPADSRTIRRRLSAAWLDHGFTNAHYEHLLDLYASRIRDEEHHANTPPDAHSIATDIADHLHDERLGLPSDWWPLLEYGPDLHHLAELITTHLIAEGHIR